MINQEIINRFRLSDKCTPRVLIVTDMSFSTGVTFSLSQFVKTIKKETVLGRETKVTKASLLPEGRDPEADISEFTFDKLLRAEYDICFIFALRGDNSWQGNPNPVSLKPDELDAIEKFMADGGGIFATGDHEDLGAGICRDIIRVRNMRKWTASQNVPSRAGKDRLSTMLSGDNETFEFADESDTHPQRIYLNWDTSAGGYGKPHPLMQASDNKAIVHIPDHPHEGECTIPSETELQNKSDWPQEEGGTEQVVPEVVAKSMSHGGKGSGERFRKEPLIPREFIAIAAYDGHRAGVGRVVTDSTWHHFLDINIDGNVSFRATHNGLQNPDGTDRPELVLIHQHWRNLAEWLMPPLGRRRCIAVSRVIREILLFPLIDELDISAGSNEKLGEQVKGMLDKALLPYQVEDLVKTVLAMGITDPVKRREASEKKKMTALGALTAALFELELGTVDEMLIKLEEAVAAIVN
jgi:hypothetical protein